MRNWFAVFFILSLVSTTSVAEKLSQITVHADNVKLAQPATASEPLIMGNNIRLVVQKNRALSDEIFLAQSAEYICKLQIELCCIAPTTMGQGKCIQLLQQSGSVCDQAGIYPTVRDC